MERAAGNARITLIVPALMAALAALLTFSDMLWRLDLWSYDSIVRFVEPEPDDSIVIVAIDERSLAEIGRWPWPRDHHARLIEQLDLAGVRGIVLDVMFAEADPAHPEGDVSIAETVARNGRVVLPVLVEPGSKGELLSEVLPLPALTEVAAGLGHTDIDPERDGLVRGAFLRAGLGQPYWSTLTLALLEAGQPLEPERLPGARSGENVDSPFLWVRDHYVMLPQMGGNGGFAHVSAVDVLNGVIPAALLADRWALVGVTAAGLGHHTQVPANGTTARIPGIEYHARILHMLETGRVVTPIAWHWRLLVSLGVIVLPFVMLWRQYLRWLPVMLAGLAIAIIVGVPALLHYGRYWLPPAVPLLLLLLLSVAWALVRMRHWQVLAHHDPLTRLANRFQLDATVGQEWTIARRTGQPMSLLLIDIDRFKAYNDSLGHAAGDRALAAVAAALSRQVRRPRDLVARYGGEEFAVILPDTDPPGARRIAEAMRQGVLALAIHHPRSPHGQQLTASIGASTVWPSRGGSAKHLFDEADRALYKAKDTGRNRIVLHDDGSPRSTPAISAD